MTSFSVHWTGAQRVLLWLAVAVFALLIAMFGYASTYQEDPGERWSALALALAFAGLAVFLLGVARYRVWLAGRRLIRQGAFWRWSLDLGKATFAMTVTRWHYTRRLGPLRLRRIEISAPTLVVRASILRRIKLPLVQRTGEQLVGDSVELAWLPQPEREALADAIERYSQASNKDKVARFLRNVTRSPVQPAASTGPLTG